MLIFARSQGTQEKAKKVKKETVSTPSANAGGQSNANIPSTSAIPSSASKLAPSSATKEIPAPLSASKESTAISAFAGAQEKPLSLKLTIKPPKVPTQAASAAAVTVPPVSSTKSALSIPLTIKKPLAQTDDDNELYEEEENYNEEEMEE
jgi:hypothetical protein